MRKPTWHAASKNKKAIIALITIAIVAIGTTAFAGDWSGEKSARAGEAMVYSREDNEIIKGTRSAEDRIKDALKASIAGRGKDAGDILSEGQTAAEKEHLDRVVATAKDHRDKSEHEISTEPIGKAVEHDHSDSDIRGDGHQHDMPADNKDHHDPRV